MKTKQQRNKLALCVGLTVCALATAVNAEPVTTYGQAVVTALHKNPAVTSAYYNFEAAREAQRVVQGGFYPSVDVSADYGWEERQTPINDFGEYDRDAVRFSITQMLFDGFQTLDQSRAAGYGKLARYYEFDQAAQDVALQATTAYGNAVLYQKLVSYAEENYVAHRHLFNKIKERANGGVSQRVDLEQATARLALAESNLLTEVSNLQDTISEFQRVVGELPAEGLPMPALPESVIPSLKEEALTSAYEHSPMLNTAIEEMRSARESYNATRSPMMPRLDLRYRNEIESNTDGFKGDYDLQAVELVFSYNLFRGGSDSARRREGAARYYSAVEARKQACLDVRRETMISFNNVRVLEQQVKYLEQQLDSQDKTRRAYADQFVLSQRSLLDLLDSQNEYFDTQRALVTSRIRLLVEQATTLANMGALTRTLDAKGFNADKIAELELNMARSEDEQIEICPAEVQGQIQIDQEAIYERLNAKAEATFGSR